MPSSFASESPALASKLSIMALTRCDAPRHRSSTRRRENYARYGSGSVMRRSKSQSATLALMSKTHWNGPSGRRSDPIIRPPSRHSRTLTDSSTSAIHSYLRRWFGYSYLPLDAKIIGADLSGDASLTEDLAAIAGRTAQPTARFRVTLLAQAAKSTIWLHFFLCMCLQRRQYVNTCVVRWRWDITIVQAKLSVMLFKSMRRKNVDLSAEIIESPPSRTGSNSTTTTPPVRAALSL